MSINQSCHVLRLIYDWFKNNGYNTIAEHANAGELSYDYLNNYDYNWILIWSDNNPKRNSQDYYKYNFEINIKEGMLWLFPINWDDYHNYFVEDPIKISLEDPNMFDKLLKSMDININVNKC